MLFDFAGGAEAAMAVLAAILVSIAISMSALGLGWGLLRALRLAGGRLRGVEDCLTAFGLGLVGLSLLLSSLAFAMLLNWWSVGALLAAGCALAAPGIPKGFPQAAWNGWIRLRGRGRLLASGGLLLILLLALEALVPDFSGDAYLYHISAPLAYTLEGGFVSRTWDFCYHYPLLINMLYIPALVFGAEQALAMLNFWMALASAAVLWALGRRLGGSRAGWVAAAIFLLAPSVWMWAPTSQPETGGVLMMLLAVLSLDRWRESRNLRLALLGGVFVGAMVGSKLLYALFAIWFGVAILGICLWDARQVARRRIALIYPAVLFVWGCGFAYLPWLLKNACFVGNPFFPVLLDRFPVEPALAAQARFYGELHGFPRWEGLLPWLRGALQGVKALYYTQDAGFVMGMLSVIPAAAWMFRVRQGRLAGVLSLGVLVVVSHYGGILQTRWFLPAYALFLVSGGVWGMLLWRRFGHWRSVRWAAGVLGLMLLVNWGFGYHARLSGWSGTSVGYHRPWIGLTARGRERFMRDLPGWLVAQRVNAHVPESGRVLVVQDHSWAQVRWYRRRFIQSGRIWLDDMRDRGLTPEQAVMELRRAGITHAVVPGGGGAEAFLEEHLERIEAVGNFVLYRLAPSYEKVSAGLADGGFFG